MIRLSLESHNRGGDMKIAKLYTVDMIACGIVRGIVPACVINTRGNWNVTCASRPTESDFYGTDVAVFQCPSTKAHLDALRAFRERGIPVVVDVDDNRGRLPPEYREHKVGIDKVAWLTCLQEADIVSCSTVELASQLHGDVPRDYHIVRNGIESVNWNPQVRQKVWLARPDKEKVVIGWFYSFSAGRGETYVKGAVRRILADFPETRVELVGHEKLSTMPGLLEECPDRVTRSPWMRYPQLPRTVAGWDIGIASVSDSEFSRAKSELKWLQYSALGIPTVATRGAPYLVVKDGEDGILAGFSEDEWYNALARLVKDRVLRTRIGDAACRRVHREYDMDKVTAPIFEKLLDTALTLRKEN